MGPMRVARRQSSEHISLYSSSSVRSLCSTSIKLTKQTILDDDKPLRWEISSNVFVVVSCDDVVDGVSCDRTKSSSLSCTSFHFCSLSVRIRFFNDVNFFFLGFNQLGLPLLV
jgi:hypothetical protein